MTMDNMLKTLREYYIFTCTSRILFVRYDHYGYYFGENLLTLYKTVKKLSTPRNRNQNQRKT